MFGAVAQLVDLPRQSRDIGLSAVGLCPRRLKRCLGDPPLGAHGRLAGEKGGKVRLGLARGGLRRRQVGRDPGSLGFAIRQPALD